MHASFKQSAEAQDAPDEAVLLNKRYAAHQMLTVGALQGLTLQTFLMRLRHFGPNPQTKASSATCLHRHSCFGY